MLALTNIANLNPITRRVVAIHTRDLHARDLRSEANRIPGSLSRQSSTLGVAKIAEPAQFFLGWNFAPLPRSRAFPAPSHSQRKPGGLNPTPSNLSTGIKNGHATSTLQKFEY